MGHIPGAHPAGKRHAASLFLRRWFDRTKEVLNESGGIFALRDTKGAFFSLLLVAVIATFLALIRKQPGAAVLLAGASYLGVRHVRLQALFACVVVVVGGTLLSSALETLKFRIADTRLRTILAGGVASLVVLLAVVRSADLISQRHYLESTDTGLFGTGLSWWFPERAAAFIEQENIPGEIFNAYDTGGYITWRLGPKYRDYIDGRAMPFGPERFKRQDRLLRTPPDSPEWQREVEQYGINAILVSLGRYDGLQFFPALKEFCTSQAWAPIYLDEISAVFVRRTPGNQASIQRSQVDCATAPLPAAALRKPPAEAFNQWANAAAVLYVLGRNPEALSATDNALPIFSDSASLHFIRANVLVAMGRLSQAEPEYLAAVELGPDEVTWSALAQFYRMHGRFPAAIKAFEQAARLSPRPHLILLNLAYTQLEEGRPTEALRRFDEAVSSAPSEATALGSSQTFLLRVAQGRASAWRALGNLGQAVSFAEEASRLAPEVPQVWLQLSDLYMLQGRTADAERARTIAEAIHKDQ